MCDLISYVSNRRFLADFTAVRQNKETNLFVLRILKSIYIDLSSRRLFVIVETIKLRFQQISIKRYL